MSDMDIDLGDQYDKPTFDISLLNKPDKFDIDLGEIEEVKLLTREETRQFERQRLAVTLKDFLAK